MVCRYVCRYVCGYVGMYVLMYVHGTRFVFIRWQALHLQGKGLGIRVYGLVFRALHSD